MPPRIQGIALGGVYLGSFTQAGKNPEALVGLDKVGLLVADIITVGSVSGGGSLQIGFSSDGGTSYGDWITLYAEPGSSVAHTIGRLHIDLATGAWRVRLLSSDNTVLATGGTLTLPSGVNALRMTNVLSDRIAVYDWFVLSSRD